MTWSTDETSQGPLVRTEGVRWVADEGLPTEREILAPTTFTIVEGERVGISGPSGAGKSTLAILLAGLLDPTSGRVFDGTRLRPKNQPPPVGRIGLVFQEPESGFFEESVSEDVAFGLRMLGIRESDAARRAEETLRLVGLDPATIGPRPPESLSGGEARRAAIAGVLAFRPRLVIFDEPTTGLDADGLDRLRSILESLHVRGSSVLVVSHDLPFLLDQCDRIVLLDRGRIVWDGPSTELARSAPDAWRAEAESAGGEMIAVARALQQQGVIGEDVPPTPESLATAWAAAVTSKRN